MEELRERIIERSYIVDSGCWEWQRALNAYGYGVIRYRDKIYLAHRCMHEFDIGPLNSLYALHKCHNRKCICPDHLYAGNQKQNMIDMRERDNYKNGNRKLTEEQVREIKILLSKNWRPSELEQKFSISRGAL